MSATLVSLWTDLRRRFEAAGVDSPVLDARLLLEAGAGVSRLDIVTDPRRELSDAAVNAVEALAARRVAREPVARILGRKHFWTLDLAVSPDVLIPRPETELLVEHAVSVLPADAEARVLDLGTGSGAILLAVLSERTNANGVGADVSAAALDVARANAEALGLAGRTEFACGSWGEGAEGPFDLVVSNPPYIARGEIDCLAPEVAQHEPRLALDGGPDGQDAYRAIFDALPTLLRPGGRFAVEVGRGQSDPVAALAEERGLTVHAVLNDLAGVARVVTGRHSAGDH